MTSATEIKKIAQEAGTAIMGWYAKDSIPVKNKADQSPVTHADEDANQVIITGLKKISSLPILTEESLVDYAFRRTWGDFWLVDPLDGTKNFLNKDGQFTVNIARISNGSPILGVVYVPALNLMYSAEKNKGATLNDKTIYHKAPNAELVAAVSAMHGSDQTAVALSKAGITKVKPLGSALKLCKIAEGEVDIYPRLGTTCEWDIAAGQLVATEGGGKIIDLKTKKEPAYNKENLENNFFVAAHRDLDLTPFFS
jgi:3'(2'), 5'-bisphosphate nucleotidase